jgi:hypothetical protein
MVVRPFKEEEATIRTADGWAGFGSRLYLITEIYKNFDENEPFRELREISITHSGHEERWIRAVDWNGRIHHFNRETILKWGYVSKKRANMEMKLGGGGWGW